jgi:hypothetical protein
MELAMPHLKLTSDDFKQFDLRVGDARRTFWRDGNWHLTSDDGDIRIGTRSLHWTSALRRAVEQIERNGK